MSGSGFFFRCLNKFNATITGFTVFHQGSNCYERIHWSSTRSEWKHWTVHWIVFFCSVCVSFGFFVFTVSFVQWLTLYHHRCVCPCRLLPCQENANFSYKTLIFTAYLGVRLCVYVQIHLICVLRYLEIKSSLAMQMVSVFWIQNWIKSAFKDNSVKIYFEDPS